ncbi:MAG TPA: hypothetical protein P5218_06910, partial [Planctomycetota bacterium]|nr:hypothetical protein [Planctomycetota bacterium]
MGIDLRARGTLVFWASRRLVWQPLLGFAFCCAALWLVPSAMRGDAWMGEVSPAARAGRSLEPWLVAWWCVLLVHLAGLGRRVARRDAAWLAPLGLRPGTLMVCTWLGAMLASSGFLVLLIGVDWKWPGHGTPALRIHSQAALTSDRVLAAGETLGAPMQADFATDQEGGQLALWVHPVLGESPTTRCRVAVMRGEVQGPVREFAVDGLRLLAADLPQGTGPIRFVVTNVGPGSIGLLGRRGLIGLVPQSPLEHGIRLGLGALSVCALVASLALSAGAWLRPSMAGFLAALGAGGLALWQPGWTQNVVSNLEAMAYGVGTKPLDAGGWLALGSLVAGFLLAGTFGLRAWG